MQIIGFSTGAFFPRGIKETLPVLGKLGIRAVELSALRDHELPRLIDDIEDLRLTSFDYISVHAPSKLKSLSEKEVVRYLCQLPSKWPVIVHPDVIQDFSNWKPLGDRMCLENMDPRKATGRVAHELSEFFEAFPSAKFCLDLGHAHRFDSTMGVAYDLISHFGERLCQVHISCLSNECQHLRLTSVSSASIATITGLIPESCPVIIESVVKFDEAWSELNVTADIFDPQHKNVNAPLNSFA